MRRFMIAVLALWLGGCRVGPDYVKPAVDVPKAFRYEAASARETANTAWWRQFQDPLLDEMIAEALVNNREVHIAAANIEQAAAVLMQSRSALFPQIGYGASGARQRGSEAEAVPIPSLVPNPQTAYQALASASWEIDLWGRIRRLAESAEAQMRATEAEWQGLILSLVSAVANTYIQLLGLDEQLRVAQRTLDTYAASLKLFELRFKYGQVSQMTVVQARSQYETAAAAIPQLASRIAQSENALCILLGRNPGPIRRDRSIYQLGLPSVPAGLPSALLANRPDIRRAEQILVAANARIGAAKALYFPAISLTGAYGYASEDLNQLFQGPARLWSYAGSFAGPIFTGGAIAGQVKQAEAARQAALFAYESTVQSAFADTENALVARAELADQLQAQERLVAANSEYVRLARLQYEGGYAPYSTVLQAEQQLFPSELEYADYRAALLTSLVNIYKAMGGGWPQAAEEARSGAVLSP
jgi:multidrug efflux system outer membrane protein